MVGRVIGERRRFGRFASAALVTMMVASLFVIAPPADAVDLFTVAFQAPSSSQVEGDSGTVNKDVIVVLSTAAALEVPATVFVEVTGGSASSPGDYTGPTPVPVTFPFGAVNGATQSATIAVNGDITDEPDETVDLGFGVISAGGSAVGQTTHTLTITNDDDDSFSVAFAAGSSSQVEGDSGSVDKPVTVVLSTATPLKAPATVVVQVTGGSALSGVDYTGPTPVPVTFPAGAANGATQNATIAVSGDITVEPNETVDLGFGAISAGGSAVGQTTHTLTIVDNNFTVAFEFASSAWTEGNTGTTPPVVNLVVDTDGLATATGPAVPGGATVEVVRTGGTAAGTDFTFTSPTPVSIAGLPDGEKVQVAPFAVIGDTLNEANETVILGFGTISPGGSAVGQTAHTLTILDDDGPPGLSVLDAEPVTEGPGTVTLKFTVALLPAAGQPITVNYATANGTAVAGADYTARPTTPLTFTPGQTTQIVSVTVLNDAVDEIDETVLLNLSGSAVAPIADAQAVGTIKDDDNQAPKIDSFLITDAAGNPRTTFSLGETTKVNVQFSDPGVADTHEVRVSWEDGSPDSYQVMPGTGVAVRNATATHAYQIAAQHTITVIITDEEGAFVRQDAIPIIVDGSSTLDTVGLVDPATGVWRLRNVIGTVSTFYYGNPGDYPFVGDWDCNGSETPGLYRQSDGYVYLRNSNTQGNADIRFFFGNPGDIPLAGDFNGNGCDTVSIYRPSEGRVFIINQLGANDGGLGAAELDYYFGNPGDKPFVGDFNRNGIETVGLHRETTGLVYFRNSHTQGNADNQFYFGDPGDRLVAGDWTRDGIDTPALFRPSNTTMYFRHSNTQGNADDQFVWGQSPWLPVAGYFGL